MSKMDKGLLHLYYGEGKGKTSALCGQLVRARGAGMSCALFRFLKQQQSAECDALRQMGIDVLGAEEGKGLFSWQMDDKQKEGWKLEQISLFRAAAKAIADGKYDVVGLDEALYLLELSIVSAEEFLAAISKRAESVELILTGHAADETLLSMADYATRMEKVCHPFDRGIKARRGIEY